ncbi:unnamed protein product (macronuclear) [Paramecium tetraurelia]|uniref:USP domain-containing protein n=1 Tax=Paramecium tetraurelia TaxID=5888 RepID=A0BX20_PARTE|nr:uncharacterized protein GSPATT00032939001 [Paramecium tetraurelia]CAK63087.1 unnamed protein product [Paramecium tetraurelia]|eukprot:XP_001430485.1 hypothetical protein (macronuclear) [Paramecium tetraurelia strain d4-2]
MNKYQKILQNMSLMALYLQPPQTIKYYIDEKLKELNSGFISGNETEELKDFQKRLVYFWTQHHQNTEQNQSNQSHNLIKKWDLNFETIQEFSAFKSQFELELMHLKNYQQEQTLREVTQKNFIEVVYENKKLYKQLEQLASSNKLLEVDKKMLEQEISKLKSEIQDLKNQINTNTLFYKESQDLKQAKVEIVKLQQDNQVLQNQIHKLYDVNYFDYNQEIELDKQHLLQNQVRLLEQQMKSQAEQLVSANAEIKQYTNEIQQLKVKNAKIINFNFESLGIRSIPIFTGVQSYLYVTMYLLELITPLSQILKINEKVCVLISQFINYIRKENDQIQSSTATQLQDLIKIQNQNDNKVNDFLFSIIDYLTKVVIKNEKEKSQIAQIIQTDDSPIFDMFFFLQRLFPINIEILPNEVPLINSIKYIRYFDTIITPQGEFSKYLNDLIKLEGQENKIDDQASDFNFIIFPQILIFNTSELSLQQADIKISLILPIRSLNPEQDDSQYQLISMIHWIQEGNQVNYWITLCKNKSWIQIKQENAQIVDINSILTFQSPHNDKELLIYERVKI